MSKLLLVLPSAPLDWELWRSVRANREPAFERTVTDPALAGDEPLCIALPAGQLLVLSLWLTTRDATLFEGLILSQLEKRGLIARNSGAEPVFDYWVLAEEESRTLVRVALLPIGFPESLSLKQASIYASAADLLPLPENQVVLWVERQNLVLAVTRGEDVVYQQILARSSSLTGGLATEIGMLIHAVEAEHLLRKVAGITVWQSPQQPIEGYECLNRLGLPVGVIERPAPKASRLEKARSRSKIIPAPLKAMRLAKKRKEQSIRLGVLAALFYIGLVFFLWVYQFQLKRKATALGEIVAEHKPAAATLETTAAAWRSLELAVDPRYYALEQFYQVAQTLPPVGVRFTSFEIKNDVMTIRGSARNAPELFKYVEALKNRRNLPKYHWKVGQPRVLTDDTAEFKIEGKRS